MPEAKAAAPPCAKGDGARAEHDDQQLDHREPHGVVATRALGHLDDVEREDDAASEHEQVAAIHGDASRGKAHQDEARARQRDPEAVLESGQLAREQVGRDGSQHRGHAREEGRVGGGRLGLAQDLERHAQGEQAAEIEPVGNEPRSPGTAREEERAEDRGKGEAPEEERQGRDRRQQILDEDEVRAPDDRHADQDGVGAPPHGQRFFFGVGLHFAVQVGNGALYYVSIGRLERPDHSPRPLRALADGLAPRRRCADGPLQPPLRPPHGRDVRPPDRGHGRRALPRGADGADPLRDGVAGPRVRRGAVPPVSARRALPGGHREAPRRGQGVPRLRDSRGARRRAQEGRSRGKGLPVLRSRARHPAR